MQRCVRVLVLFLVLSGAQRLSADAAAVNAGTWVDTGNQLYQQSKFNEAYAAYQQAVGLEPNHAKAWQGVGNALQQLGRNGEALIAYENSLKLQAENPVLSAYVVRLRAHVALTGANVTVTAEPSVDEEALAEKLQEARGLLEARDLNGALKLFKEGAVVAPKDAEWPKGQAESFYALGQFNQAREAMRKARKLAPDNVALKALEARYYHSGLEDESEGGNIFPPLWRSALMPGWGQVYNGQKDKGVLMGGVTMALLAGTVVTYLAAGSAADDYRKLGAGTAAADFDAAFAKADGMAIANQVLGLCFYGAYAYNLFDAGAHARPVVTASRDGIRVALLETHF